VREPSKILVITDLGAAGAHALRAGAARALQTGAQLGVVHAMHSLAMARPISGAPVVDDALRQALLPERIGAAFAAHVAEHVGGAVTSERFLETGDPSEVALAVADRWGADLLITGAPEDGALDAKRLVRHAPVPVLIARAGPDRGPVIACTDFSDPSLPAVRAAADEARRTGDRLYVVHALVPLPLRLIGVEGAGVMPFAAWQRSLRVEAEHQLAATLAAAEVDGEYVAVDGPAVPALVATGRDLAARLLVLGTFGRTGPNRFLLGSVAESMVGAATCSTMIVRLRPSGA
jgi:nucleotide-binding universal stress UspA family protein